MKVIRIDHVSLNVADRERSMAWYAEVLGLRGSGGDQRPDDEPIFLGADGAQVALFADRAPGLRHVALATDAAGQAEVRATLERLEIPYRFVRHAHHDSLYFADPDGSTIEVMVAPG